MPGSASPLTWVFQESLASHSLEHSVAAQGMCVDIKCLRDEEIKGREEEREGRKYGRKEWADGHIIFFI